MSAELVQVPFHGHEIVVIQDPRGQWVAIKPLCQQVGVDEEAQRKRIVRAAWSKNSTSMMEVVLPGSQGARRVFCLHRKRLAMWLATLDVRRVKPEVRPYLALLQNEAADVLDRHFGDNAAIRTLVDSEVRRVVETEVRVLPPLRPVPPKLYQTVLSRPVRGLEQFRLQRTVRLGKGHGHLYAFIQALQPLQPDGSPGPCLWSADRLAEAWPERYLHRKRPLDLLSDLLYAGWVRYTGEGFLTLLEPDPPLPEAAPPPATPQEVPVDLAELAGYATSLGLYSNHSLAALLEGRTGEAHPRLDPPPQPPYFFPAQKGEPPRTMVYTGRSIGRALAQLPRQARWVILWQASFESQDALLLYLHTPQTEVVLVQPLRGLEAQGLPWALSMGRMTDEAHAAFRRGFEQHRHTLFGPQPRRPPRKPVARPSRELGDTPQPARPPTPAPEPEPVRARIEQIQVITALCGLGYRKADAQRAAVRAMEEHPGASLQTLLRLALRALQRN